MLTSDLQMFLIGLALGALVSWALFKALAARRSERGERDEQQLRKAGYTEGYAAGRQTALDECAAGGPNTAAVLADMGWKHARKAKDRAGEGWKVEYFIFGCHAIWALFEKRLKERSGDFAQRAENQMREWIQETPNYYQNPGMPSRTQDVLVWLAGMRWGVQQVCCVYRSDQWHKLVRTIWREVQPELAKAQTFAIELDQDWLDEIYGDAGTHDLKAEPERKKVVVRRSPHRRPTTAYYEALIEPPLPPECGWEYAGDWDAPAAPAGPTLPWEATIGGPAMH